MLERWLGMPLYGYCEGYFGRNSYDRKIIEAIGRDWVVVRLGMEATAEFATFKSAVEMVDCLTRWSVGKRPRAEALGL